MKKLKTTSQLILEASDKKVKYGCLMLYIDYDRTEIDKMIEKEDINKDEGGIEDESHITILYGFHDNTDPDKVIELAEKKGNIRNLKKIPLSRVSLFKNEKADVLKFDITEAELNKLNKLMCNEFDYTNTHPTYHAHSTIAYLMPGTGEKYLKKLANTKTFAVPTKLVYSDAKKKKTTLDLGKADKKQA